MKKITASTICKQPRGKILFACWLAHQFLFHCGRVIFHIKTLVQVLKTIPVSAIISKCNRHFVFLLRFHHFGQRAGILSVSSLYFLTLETRRINAFNLLYGFKFQPSPKAAADGQVRNNSYLKSPFCRIIIATFFKLFYQLSIFFYMNFRVKHMSNI